MKAKAQHSKIPYRVIRCDIDGSDTYIIDDENDLIVDTYASSTQVFGVPEKEVAEANAEFICKAVNNYSDLVKALDDLVEDCEGRCIPDSAEDGYDAYHQAKAVLATVFDHTKAVHVPD